MPSNGWDSAWQSAQTAIADEDFLTAVTFLQQAAVEAEAFEPSDDRQADTLMLLGSVLARLQRTEGAEHAMSRAVRLRIENLGMDHPLVPASLYVMGEMLRHAGLVLEARNALVVAAEIMERLGLEDELRGQVEYSLAIVLQETGLPTESLRHSVKAWPLLGEDSPLRLPMLNLAATLGIDHNDYAFAASAFERIAAMQAPGPEQNATLGSLADMQLAQGQFENALKTVERALLDNQEDDADLLRRQGIACSRLGDYGRAEAALARASEATFSCNGKAELAKIIGDVNLRAGDWEKAATRYAEALQLVSRDPRLRATLRLALGKVLVQLGRHQEAQKHLACAAGLRKRMEFFPVFLVAEALALLGQIYNLSGNGQKSQPRLAHALALMENDPTPVEVMRTQKQEDGLRITQLILRELAVSLELQQQFGESAGVLLPVVQLHVQMSDPEAASMAQKLSELYGRAEQPEQAREWAEKAATLLG